MAVRNETKITDVITVDSVIDVYSFSMTADSLLRENPLVVYDYWQMVYVERGEYTCSIDGDIFFLRGGQALFCEPGGTRYVVSQKDAKISFISFRCQAADMKQLSNRIVSITLQQRALLARIFTIGDEAFVDIPDGQLLVGQQVGKHTTLRNLQIMKNALELLLLELPETPHSQKPNTEPLNQNNYYHSQFERMKEFMEQRLSRNLSVETLCDSHGLSPATVKRIFQCCTGMGAVHYFQVLRMKEAKRLIRESDLSITAIAEKLGFSGIHHFSRVFRKVTGMTPTQYAKSIVQN